MEQSWDIDKTTVERIVRHVENLLIQPIILLAESSYYHIN
ncbi:hypothetical protein H6F51_18525 [Cyanobacteria bacterium FACHB-DQ100]|nr:hypothetical protein [Cyanobacteria bacterium FACHB-DQ100]